jgi:hypothetical protein
MAPLRVPYLPLPDLIRVGGKSLLSQPNFPEHGCHAGASRGRRARVCVAVAGRSFPAGRRGAEWGIWRSRDGSGAAAAGRRFCCTHSLRARFFPVLRLPARPADLRPAMGAVLQLATARLRAAVHLHGLGAETERPAMPAGTAPSTAAVRPPEVDQPLPRYPRPARRVHQSSQAQPSSRPTARGMPTPLPRALRRPAPTPTDAGTCLPRPPSPLQRLAPRRRPSSSTRARSTSPHPSRAASQRCPARRRRRPQQC